MIDTDLNCPMFEKAPQMPVSNRQKPAAARYSLRTPGPEPFVSSTFDVTPSPLFRRKPAVDRLLAVLLLIPGLPMIGLLMLLMRLTSRGRAIFRQARVGKDGKVFTMFKIRTMRHDAEEGVGATWSTLNDPRTTRVGRWIRKLHLDELPQLFNVLRGEMSLVGPRPERPEFVCVLEEALPGYRNRVSVLPGVTGLAQLCLPPDSDLCSACRKLVLDLEYIHSATLATDMRLLVCTFLRLPKLPLWMVMGLCGLRVVSAGPECSRCQVYKCNGYNGHQSMTAIALRCKVERSLGDNGKQQLAASGNGHATRPVAKPR